MKPIFVALLVFVASSTAWALTPIQWELCEPILINNPDARSWQELWEKGDLNAFNSMLVGSTMESLAADAGFQRAMHIRKTYFPTAFEGLPSIFQGHKSPFQLSHNTVFKIFELRERFPARLGGLFDRFLESVVGSKVAPLTSDWVNKVPEGGFRLRKMSDVAFFLWISTEHNKTFIHNVQMFDKTVGRVDHTYKFPVEVLTVLKSITSSYDDTGFIRVNSHRIPLESFYAALNLYQSNARNLQYATEAQKEQLAIAQSMLDSLFLSGEIKPELLQKYLGGVGRAAFEVSPRRTDTGSGLMFALMYDPNAPAAVNQLLNSDGRKGIERFIDNVWMGILRPHFRSYGNDMSFTPWRYNEEDPAAGAERDISMVSGYPGLGTKPDYPAYFALSLVAARYPEHPKVKHLLSQISSSLNQYRLRDDEFTQALRKAAATAGVKEN